MADENAVVSEADSAETKTAAPKKTRKPRQPKVAPIPLAKVEPVKRGKRVAKPTVETPQVANTTIKATRKPAQPKPITTKAASSPAAPVNDISDLLKLEEENQQLRKTLADKLRSENAELKKKLGMA
jgi:hypothetical protein